MKCRDILLFVAVKVVISVREVWIFPAVFVVIETDIYMILGDIIAIKQSVFNEIWQQKWIF